MASIAAVRPTLPEITPEAFLALEQSQTFYGTPDNLPEIEPGDPRLDDPNQLLLPPHIPISPLAVAFNALGMNARARRIDYCKHYRLFSHTGGDCPPERQTISCMQEACPDCRRRLFEDREERFYKNVRYMRKRKSYTLIELTGLEEHDFPTHDQLATFTEQVAAFIETFNEENAEIPGTGVRYRTDIQYIPVPATKHDPPHYHFRLVAYLLWWGDYPSWDVDSNRECVPDDCLIKEMTRPQSKLREDLKFIHTYNVPPTHELSARLELSDEGIRRIRTAGQMARHDPEALPEEDSLQSEELFANTSGPDPANANNSPKHPAGCCKKCGTPFTEVTGWVPPGSSVEELAQVRRYQIPQSPPG